MNTFGPRTLMTFFQSSKMHLWIIDCNESQYARFMSYALYINLYKNWNSDLSLIGIRIGKKSHGCGKDVLSCKVLLIISK